MMPLLPKAVDTLCICHILNSAGQRIESRAVGPFISGYVTLIGHSHAALRLWGEIIGEAPLRFSAIRWFCRAEIIIQVAPPGIDPGPGARAKRMIGLRRESTRGR
eukprot:COSAG01_NODE_29739_length_630_cov_2.702448_1_plen_104_part_10